MSRYYLIKYVQRPDGAWVSPPECEQAWREGRFKQVRFDPATGVALVKNLGDIPLPIGTELVNPTTDIASWLSGIARIQKSGPTIENPNAPVVPLSLEEEVLFVKKLGTGFGDTPQPPHKDIW